MNILLFGATGMVGQGALRECLLAPDVTRVQTVDRRASGPPHARLTELLHQDLFDCRAIEAELSHFDACFYCIGVSSAGMGEAQYTGLTHDMTLAVADTLARLNPQMTFVYVSAAGANSSEAGRSMWARVRGRTENALQQLPFKAAYMLRPGIIQPLHGIRSRTAAYRWLYILSAPLLPLLRRLLPDTVLSTEILGRAMLALARRGGPGPVLEAADIRALGRAA